MHGCDLNMTLSMGGLAALNNTSYPEREPMSGSLFMNVGRTASGYGKMAGLKASAAVCRHIEHLQKLMRDPVFDPDNPNKLRSQCLGHLQWPILFSFIKEDGSGYQFIAEQMLVLG